jgi:pimeloyl-ACP methyl ester carboxylesterase
VIEESHSGADRSSPGRGERRPDGSYLFVVIAGNTQIAWPKLRSLLGVSKMKLPDAAEALEATGYERGTITPIGSEPDWPVILTLDAMWPTALSRRVLELVWLALGLAMIAVPVWLGWTRWSAILNGHPAMLIAGIACGLVGFIAVAWSIATLTVGARQDRGGSSEHPNRTSTQVLRRAQWRIILAVPLLALSFLLVVLLAYARPFVATPTAIAATRSEKGVRFSDRLGWYELIPVREDPSGEAIKPTAGVVFVPGARVDSRAYAGVLRPLAEAGYLVTVLKEPFGLAIVDADHGRKVLDLHPEIAHWVVGGHSLGGSVAASLADNDDRVEGLVLFASYPGDPIIRNDLKVLSISGTADGFTTPADVEASRAKLSPNTSFVAINGAVHSSFGDYGDQPGDGAPTIERSAAQAEISKVTLALLATVAPPPENK